MYKYTIKYKESSYNNKITKIKFNNKKVPILIASNNIKNGIHNNQIVIINNNMNKSIKLERILDEDKDLGLTIFELQNEEKKDLNFLEIDERLYEKEVEFYYYEESIYIIHYNNKFNDILVSYGLLHK